MPESREVVSVAAPIGSRRRLGAELRRLRNENALTLDEVAALMTCSASKISRLETGKAVPKVPDIRELMRIYGVESEDEQATLLRLVRDGREHGWWEPLTDGVQSERFVLESLDRYVALENDATAVRSVDLIIVHGLLQTEGYMRAIMATLLPHHSAAEIDRLVQLRLTRQEALRRVHPEPLTLVAVMDESVLHRPVGGPDVMTAQLEQLYLVADRPNVDIRILPFVAGILRAHAGHFELLEIPRDLGSNIVYVEGAARNSYLDGESDVELYRTIHADALGAALSRAESRALIERYLHEHQLRTGR
jgi:transcriptional regulator with XRE-family HTH domain